MTTVDWDDLFAGDPKRQDIDFWRKREDFLSLALLTLGVRDDDTGAGYFYLGRTF